MEMGYNFSVPFVLEKKKTHKKTLLLLSPSLHFSVRIWLGKDKELLNSSEVDSTPLLLLKKVAITFEVPLSTYIFFLN